MKETKLSSNPSFGMPHARKINRRLNAWKTWGRGMSMLHSIHAEIKDALTAKATATDWFETVAKEELF